MFTRLCILPLALLLLWAGLLEGNTATVQPTYQQVLYEQILIQEDRAAFYLTQMQINPDFSSKFREAEKMLEVKEVLYKNFSQSPALVNPNVSAFLLKLMREEKIEAAELLALQKMVNAQLHRD